MIKKSDNTRNSGFTLVELLVVIAIISMLSSVILSSLNSARNKSADAAVKANLSNMRTQAELFYDANNNRYNGNSAATDVCDLASATGASTGGVKGVYPQLLAAATASNTSTIRYGNNPSLFVGTNTSATCHSSNANGTWAAEVPLKSGGMWCVDSSGASSYYATFTLTTTTDTTCG